jgi:hypothetical protein
MAHASGGVARMPKDDSKRARMTDSGPEGWPVYLNDFVNCVLVECPRCGACATIRCPKGICGTPALSCAECAFTKKGWPPPTAVEMRGRARRRCPRCNDWLGKAPVRYRTRKRVVEIACVCGAVIGESWPRARMVLGGSTDPYYGLPLWLRAGVRGEELWAYNREHLAFVEAYVRAKIRRRAPKWNASLASRLPRWLKNAAGREDVLRALTRIARRVPKTSAPPATRRARVGVAFLLNT